MERIRRFLGFLRWNLHSCPQEVKEAAYRHLAFQTPIANTDVYKGSFFPQTIRDWNALPDSLISSAEDAEDCVAKFTSLVRDRLVVLRLNVPVNNFSVISGRSHRFLGN